MAAYAPLLPDYHRVSLRGIVGTLAFHRLSYAALLIPGGLTAMTSVTYGLWSWSHRSVDRRVN